MPNKKLLKDLLLQLMLQKDHHQVHLFPLLHLPKKGNKIAWSYNRINRSTSHRDITHLSDDAAELQKAFERNKYKK